MSLNLDHAPEVDHLGLRDGHQSPSFGRRSFLASALAATAGLALAAFQKPALAHSGTSTDYSIVSGCGGVNYPNCGGCNTTNRVIGGCCNGHASGQCPQGNGYHRHAHSLGYDLRPNVCPNYGATQLSGWTWQYGGCCTATCSSNASYWQMFENRRWRCHDGYINGKPSICRWVISSGSACGPCFF